MADAKRQSAEEGDGDEAQRGGGERTALTLLHDMIDSQS